MAVFFYGCITLDGYLATKEHGLNWLYDTGSPEETSCDEFYSHMDVVLMGRQTFEEIEKIENPAASYPATENYVFTHRELACPGFTAVHGSPVEFVKELGNNRNIWVVGGNTILAPLLDQNMVDCLIVQVAPVLLGAGIPLFTQKETLHRFHLESVRQYGQFAELVYCRKTKEDKGYSGKDASQLNTPAWLSAAQAPDRPCSRMPLTGG